MTSTLRYLIAAHTCALKNLFSFSIAPRHGLQAGSQRAHTNILKKGDLRSRPSPVCFDKPSCACTSDLSQDKHKPSHSSTVRQIMNLSSSTCAIKSDPLPFPLISLDLWLLRAAVYTPHKLPLLKLFSTCPTETDQKREQ